MMAALCPECGFDLINDEPIERDGIRFDPRGDIAYHDVAIHLTGGERVLLGTLLKDAGRFINRATLHERLGYEGDYNLVDVLLSRLRSKLKQVMGCNPIETAHRVGIRWKL